MGAPREVLEAMLADANVLALVAGSEDVAVTPAVIEAVAKWFHDVEIIFPIPQMELDENEKRSLTSEIADELVSEFRSAIAKVNARGELADEDFEQLARNTDPLFRELSGVYADQLNAQFEENRVDAEDAQEAINDMLSMIERMHGQDGLAEFRTRSKTDSTLRAQLRRMGLDPDKI